MKALEEKYATQKSIVLKLDEHILELSKNHRIGPACSPTDERMGKPAKLSLNLFSNFYYLLDTATGYTSPLSISFSSDQDGLSSSLRSTSDIRPLASTSNVSAEQLQQSQHPNLQRQSSIHDN